MEAGVCGRPSLHSRRQAPVGAGTCTSVTLGVGCQRRLKMSHFRRLNMSHMGGEPSAPGPLAEFGGGGWSAAGRA